MLIYRGGCLRIANLYVRPPENWSDMTAAVRRVVGIRFIEVYDENAVPSRFECRVAGQGA